ncbi:MAG TPA: phenylalanine--tRNA ligase subunit beta [Thermotogota bacterium]|nr:phenylalanine--tRNA ligase subunit beta [Thermotogota bacterium]HRW92462.1 phenylalanine--tRNA ligase subunit beta [Thermotogota bacterium]
MYVSKKWLNHYIPVSDLSDGELEQMFSLSGTSIESIEKPWEGMENVVSGVLTRVEPHPNADQLLVCRVSTGNEEHTVLTADRTMREGQKVLFAPVGSRLFDGKKIEKVTMRGIESQGMLCSLQELGLEDRSLEVFKAADSLRPGTRIFYEWDLDDSVFDCEVTANRPDELSVIGLGRELQAVSRGERRLQSPPIDFAESETPTGELVDISVEDSENCFRYTSLVVENVQVGPSPLWLRRHLVASGLRPINNVVDITNFVLLEMGHPVHAFDLDRLSSPRVVVRRAKKGETLLLLNEQELVFDGDELLITDGQFPLALAGVMGGERSGIGTDTRRVLLEVASFNPVNIRRTLRKFNLTSDAGYRFERGVDVGNNREVLRRLAHLLQQVTGATVSKGIIDVFPHPMEAKQVSLRKCKVEALLGFSLPSEQIENILKNLGMGVESAASSEGVRWNVRIPTFRPDIEREVDLVEEIGRIHGYDQVASTLPVIRSKRRGRSPIQDFRLEIRNFFLGTGFNETYSLSLIDPEDFSRLHLPPEHPWRKQTIELIKPLSKEISVLRPTLLPNFLRMLSYNFTHQVSDVKLFELANLFQKRSAPAAPQVDEYNEQEMVGFAMMGKQNPDDFSDHREVDFFALKGVVEELLQHMRIPSEFVKTPRIEREDPYATVLYPAQAARIEVRGEAIGVFGRLKRKVAGNFDIKQTVYFGEVDVARLHYWSEETKMEWKSVQGTNFPASKKDFSLLVPRGKEMGHILQDISEISGVEKVRIIDVYRGKGIADGYTSITLSVVLRSLDHTISEEEIRACLDRVLLILNREQIEIREG